MNARLASRIADQDVAAKRQIGAAAPGRPVQHADHRRRAVPRRAGTARAGRRPAPTDRRPAPARRCRTRRTKPCPRLRPARRPPRRRSGNASKASISASSIGAEARCAAPGPCIRMVATGRRGVSAAELPCPLLPRATSKQKARSEERAFRPPACHGAYGRVPWLPVVVGAVVVVLPPSACRPRSDLRPSSVFMLAAPGGRLFEVCGSRSRDVRAGGALRAHLEQTPGRRRATARMRQHISTYSNLPVPC